jgi:hypothetical protein
VPAPAAADSCDFVLNVTVMDTRTDGSCAGYYSLRRAITAADSCGNTATAVQNISVQVSLAPVCMSSHGR